MHRGAVAGKDGTTSVGTRRPIGRATVGANSGNGAAYVFHVASEGAWSTTATPTATLSNSSAVPGDRNFGGPVAISANGTTALVGEASGVREADVFSVAGPGAWATTTTPTAILTDHNYAMNLGYSVALSADGTTALAGDPYVGGSTGAVDVFQTSLVTQGDAGFYGSTGNIALAQPIVGMAADPVTGGYWFVAGDGGVFSFDAPFYGSMGNRTLVRPAVGMASTSDGGGYWLVATDGGIFSF